ncbi:hypothetical protein JW968_03335 [Candidatus Woesearchaeota archaeon]|nr:hypothetical protein [Candidatus Woesearchaeota archaeon]
MSRAKRRKEKKKANPQKLEHKQKVDERLKSVPSSSDVDMDLVRYNENNIDYFWRTTRFMRDKEKKK